MAKYILKNFHCLNKSHKIVGNKAKNLAFLLRHGYAVPSFFVVTTALFQHVSKKFSVSTNNVDSYDEAKKFFDSMEFGSTNLPSKFWKSFEGQFNLLKNAASPAAVSVRSSSPYEDSTNQSFAGQFVTFLDVKNKIDAWKAIKQCWLSLWQPNVLSYLQEARIRGETKAMAVIIQQMVHPDFSGVLFSFDPVQTNNDLMLLEFSCGTAETLVSGSVNPCRLQINKRTREIYWLASLDKNKAADKILPFFSNEKIQQLATVGINLEKQWQKPIDIEWALEREKLWLLQVRPITVGLVNERQRRDENGDVWTDYFFVERFVDPVTPLGWTIIGKWIEKRALREPLYFLGFDKLSRQRVITKTFAACPHSRIEVFQSLYSVVPDFALSEDKKRAFINQSKRRLWWRELIKRAPYLFSRLVFGDTNFFPPLHLRAWSRFLNRYVHQLANNTKQLDELQLAQLRNWFLQVEALTDEFLSYHRWSITFADLLFHLVERILPLLIPETKSLNKVDLFGGLPGNKTVEANVALSQMAQRFQSDKLKSKNISIKQLDKIPGFKSNFEKFLQRHGHRAQNLDPYYPTWRENPLFIKQMICDLMSAPDGKSAIESSQLQATKNRQQAESFILSALAKQNFVQSFFKKKLIFSLLELTQSFVLLRENQRYYWHIASAEKRRIILEIGRRLVAKKAFDSAEQIFFLQRKEFLNIFETEADLSRFRKKALLRQKEWKQTTAKSGAQAINQKISKSEVFSHRGLGVSAGKIAAKASVAYSLIEAQNIIPGTILVTRSVDPAWTPVFAKAAGLVLEVGGILSHASIVAREFKLPAVTCVAQATQKIKNNQLIEIDGLAGIITIVRE